MGFITTDQSDINHNSYDTGNNNMCKGVIIVQSNANQPVQNVHCYMTYVTAGWMGLYISQISNSRWANDDKVMMDFMIKNPI